LVQLEGICTAGARSWLDIDFLIAAVAELQDIKDVLEKLNLAA